jgi:hypothetical protein
MAYVPPRLRKEKTVDQKTEEAMKIVQDSSDKHFPTLGGGALAVSRPTISYGDKAKEWEQKRFDSEVKERVDARMAEIREEKRKEEIPITIIHKRRPEPAKVMPLPVLEPEPQPLEKNEWTTVEKKPRKPKKKVEQVVELEFNDKFEHLAEDQESLWS